MTNILIAGVGGQGILLASVILGRAALAQDLDVKMSEVHGMSQRGGSVVSQVRIGAPGELVASPVIAGGEADILLAFEQMEALRWAEYMNPAGRVYVNTQKIPPLPVMTGQTAYPEDIGERIRDLFAGVQFIDAVSLAEQAGSTRAVNTVLLGAMSAASPIPEDIWLTAVDDSVKAPFRSINRRAFELGRKIGEEK